jgi:phenylacetyl-CoA:acceptor oxidoreductase 26-kDa subunit
MSAPSGQNAGRNAGRNAGPAAGWTSGRTAPWHQTNWDLRAAGNFVFGGAGTGLIVFAAIGHALGAAYVVPALMGLALVGAGLLCVWAEIGRPFRAMNVYRHARTSWMTREAMVAPFLFGSGLGAVWTGSEPLNWLAAALALVYLTCQAQMIRASKGIPAWRHPRIVALAMLTGLTEGCGFALLVAAATGDRAYLKWLGALLLVLVLARGFAWYAYRSGLQRDGAPAKALAALSRIELPFTMLGNWAPVVLLFVALASSSANMLFWLGVVSALAALGSGWLFKVVLITRAAYNQGYALPRLPVRGAGTPGPAVKPGWN